MALKQNYTHKGLLITDGYFRIDKVVLTHITIDNVKTYNIYLVIGLYASSTERDSIIIITRNVQTTDESNFNMAYMYEYLKSESEFSGAIDV